MPILKARKNQSLYLSPKQEKILIGCILGDAYISKNGKVQIEHSQKHKGYIDWKYSELKSVSYGPPRMVSRYDKRYKKNYFSYRFWTRQFFKSWRKRFYKNNRKVFPTEYQKKLSPLTLAIWYMDDGSLSEKRRVILSTEGFDSRNINRICKTLKYCFNLKVLVKSNGKIMIGTKETRKFMDIVKPLIIEIMKYKIL